LTDLMDNQRYLWGQRNRKRVWNCWCTDDCHIKWEDTYPLKKISQ